MSEEHKFSTEILSSVEPPIVDVVIPYSPAHTPKWMLLEAIESVRDQTVPARVVTIVDHHQSGPAMARNIGLEIADERYVAFLDADDLWEPTKLERQIERMDRTGAGLCLEGESMSTETFIKSLLGFEIWSLTPSILVDTSKVSARFDESLLIREDHLYMIEAATEAGVCFCEDLVIVRKHEQGLSFETNLTSDSAALFWEKVQERVPYASRFERTYWGSALIHVALTDFERGHWVDGSLALLRAFRWDPRPKPLILLGAAPLIVLYYKYGLNQLRRRR